jgi:hypothetical protein
MKSLLAALATLALLPASALAVEAEGEGVNVRHLENVPHTEAPNTNTSTNEGTDIEFATITLPGAPATPAKACKKPRKGLKGKQRKRAQKRFKACKRKDAKPAQPGIQRTFAFVGSYFDGVDVVDVTDRANPRVVANYDCGIAQGDVQVFQRDGRWFLAYADDAYEVYASRCTRDLPGRTITDGETPEDGGGVYIAEVTDPYHPRTVSFVPLAKGSHNVTVHPSGRYLYNSNSELITSLAPAVEIIDISDLAAPKEVGAIDLEVYPGLGTESHDISFSREGDRAYVAALSHGEILDTTDPAAPKHVSTILDPAINVWHQTERVRVGEKTYLLAEDEFAGATGTGQCPNGALHVYDITDETAPAKVGAFQIADAGLTASTLGRCTAHVFQVHEREGILLFGWYNAGVRVLDLSELEGYTVGDVSTGGIRQLGSFTFPDADVWSAKAPTVSRDGFVFYANDHARGLDVYEYTPGPATAPGRWLTPAQALAGSRALRASAGGRLPSRGICFLPGG